MRCGVERSCRMLRVIMRSQRLSEEGSVVARELDISLAVEPPLIDHDLNEDAMSGRYDYPRGIPCRTRTVHWSVPSPTPA